MKTNNSTSSSVFLKLVSRSSILRDDTKSYQTPFNLVYQKHFSVNEVWTGPTFFMNFKSIGAPKCFRKCGKQNMS